MPSNVVRAARREQPHGGTGESAPAAVWRCGRAGTWGVDRMHVVTWDLGSAVGRGACAVRGQRTLRTATGQRAMRGAFLIMWVPDLGLAPARVMDGWRVEVG
eukprot:3503020-Prymnesium_polylepis.3